MDRLRFAACLALLVAMTCGIYTYYVYYTPQNWDETFHVKGALVSPSDYESREGYRYAIDHPTIGRYVYRWVLFGVGVRELDIPDVAYPKGEKWNTDNGRIPSLAVTIPLRFANAAFMLGAVILIFLAAFVILGNPWLSLFAALPVVLSERIASGVVGYLGTDAILAFFTALTLFVWVALARKGRDRGLLGILAIAGAGALVVSTKANGALVPVAYMVYLALVTRGIDRIAKPLLAALVCGVVFFALNPVMRGGGMSWAIAVVRDMLDMRQAIWMSQYSQDPMARGDLIRRFFAYPAFVLPLLGALVALRREKWVLPLALWSGLLVAGTLLSVNRLYQRYFLPVEMAMFVSGGIAAWRLLQVAMRRSAAANPGGADGPRGRRAAAAIAVAVGAGLVALTFLAAYEPWGALRVRRGTTPVNKIALFYRQSAAYYGLARELPMREIRAKHLYGVGLGRAAQDAAGEGDFAAEPQDGAAGGPLFEAATRQAMNTGVFVVACALVVLIGKRALGSAWCGVALAGVFFWAEAMESKLWMHSASESYLILFALGALYVWIVIREQAGAASWSMALAAGALSGAAMAASPKGALLVAATAALLYVKGRSKEGLACGAAAVAAGIVVYAALEPALWYLGSRASFEFAQGVRRGSLDHWAASFKMTLDFLMPLQERFPYLMLVPLGAAALYAARRAAWALPVALWAGSLAGGALLTIDVLHRNVATDTNLALIVGAGLPGLMLLRDNVYLRIGFKDRAPLKEDGSVGTA